MRKRILRTISPTSGHYELKDVTGEYLRFGLDDSFYIETYMNILPLDHLAVRISPEIKKCLVERAEVSFLRFNIRRGGQEQVIEVAHRHRRAGAPRFKHSPCRTHFGRIVAR